ncbi:MAG: GNAT family N-acetyltransferase [Chloroflexota bacterium]
MRPRVAIVYNAPAPSRYHDRGEDSAVLDVLESVSAVDLSLNELGYEVRRVPLLLPLEQAEGKLRAIEADVVFNLFEGFCGYPETEAAVPEMLAALGIPFTGCPGAALRQALDKAGTNALLRAHGVDTPAFQVLTPETVTAFRLSFPCIVKPRGEDASHGLSAKSVVHDAAALREQVAYISRGYGGQALVEEFIDGREFNVTVLGNSSLNVLPVSEINYALPPGVPRIITFAGKWQPDSPDFQGTKVICPAEISAETVERVRATALQTFRLLGCRGYARVDLRWDGRDRLGVIDVNPNPDISPHAGAIRQAARAGMDYTRFIGKIVQLALEKRMAVKMRPLRRADKPALMAILQRTPEFKPSEVAVAEEVLDSCLHDPVKSGYCSLVAALPEGVAGYICYGPTPLTEGTWDLYWMAVSPEKQGQGIGRALLGAAEEHIRREHGRMAVIETSSQPAYARIVRFHEHCGYREVGRVPDFYAPGDDRLLLVKRLD